MLVIYKISLILTTITTTVLGSFVLIRNPRSMVNRMWFFTSLCVAVWAFGFRYTLEPDPVASLFAARWSNYFASLIPLFYAHFSLAFVGLRLRDSKPLMIGYTFNVLLSLAMFHPLFVPSVIPKMFFTHYANPGPLFFAYTCMFFYLAIYAHYILFKYLKKQHPRHQNQIKYILIATVTGFLSGIPTFLLVYDVRFEPWTVHFLPVYTFIIAYAILKHQLMDITIIIRKSVIYSILVAMMTAIYLVFVILAERLLQDVMGYKTLAFSLLTAFVVALGFIPLKNWIQSFVDRYFFKGTQAAIAAENDRLRHELQHTEKMKAVSLFASGMAHEIKNPLTSLKTFVEHLPSKGNDAAFREKFTRIVGNEVKNIEAIVHRLLDFAKPSKPELQPIRLCSVLDDTLSFLQADMVQKHLKLTKSYTDRDTVHADPAQLKQVFLNLFLNAIDATPPGGTIGAAINPNGRHIHVTITDTGPGMTPEDLKRAGEPFFTTKANGTGLGLAVVKGIVEGHGGKIRMESGQTTGTRMHVSFPAAIKPSGEVPVC